MTRNRLVVGGLAAGGIAVSHWLAYLVAAPDPHARAHALAASGHRYLMPFVALCVGLTIAALAGAFRRFATTPTTPAPKAGRLVMPLAGIQTIGFVVLEALERGLFAHGFSLDLLAETPVVAGIVVQLVVALVGALLLAVVAGVARILRASSPSRTRAGTYRWVPSQTAAPRLRLAAGGLTYRGPPARS